MNVTSCKREAEVKALLERGHWPQACDEELSAHVAGCGTCSDRVRLTEGFRQARAQAMAAAPLVAPGLLWWKAQLRRRHVALERLNQPVLSAQILVLSASLLAGVAVCVFRLRTGAQWLGWLKSAPLAVADALTQLWNVGLGGSGWMLTASIMAISAAVLLGGAIVYLAAEKQ
jgi:hypothetical protein